MEERFNISSRNHSGVKSGQIYMSYKSIFQSVRSACDWLHLQVYYSRVVDLIISSFKIFILEDAKNKINLISCLFICISSCNPCFSKIFVNVILHNFQIININGREFNIFQSIFNKTLFFKVLAWLSFPWWERFLSSQGTPLEMRCCTEDEKRENRNLNIICVQARISLVKTWATSKNSHELIN